MYPPKAPGKLGGETSPVVAPKSQGEEILDLLDLGSLGKKLTAVPFQFL